MNPDRAAPDGGLFTSLPEQIFIGLGAVIGSAASSR